MTQDTLEHIAWFTKQRPILERLAQTAQAVLSELLTARGIRVLAVTSRVKSAESFAQKVARKGYRDPRTEVTDLAGLRIITYLESDLAKVEQIVRESFSVDDLKSVDKLRPPAPDVVGYRSKHIICTLGMLRAQLPEYTALSDIKFEIQLRTALQHAWAEVEHDRGYKFGGVLPADLRRRFHLAAGTLELIDREFSAIAFDIDAYASSVRIDAQQGTLDGPLSTTGLRALLELRAKNFKRIRWRPVNKEDVQTRLIEELQDFGVTTLRHAAELLSDAFLAAEDQHLGPTSDVGIMRDAMMFSDLHRYFRDAFKKRWLAMEPDGYDFLVAKYGQPTIDRLLVEHDIQPMPRGAMDFISDFGTDVTE